MGRVIRGDGLVEYKCDNPECQEMRLVHVGYAPDGWVRDDKGRVFCSDGIAGCLSATGIQELRRENERAERRKQDTNPTNTTFTKYDAGKARYDLIPATPLHEVVLVLTHGAEKYGDENWRKGATDRYFAAAMRHLWAWWRGEETDAESGLSHLAHAACCVLFLMGLSE